ncbi:hypothetical protein PybrP1_000497 [[Pythium] brassicae (nom. inval.)]|nr:hypothetical protein PybrP1_000497 [[Pythium] brassicae (nom. inval.)]
MVFSQLLSIGWNTAKSSQLAVYGRDPTEGVYAIPGLNDEPYADRVLACVADGRHYRAASVSELLRSNDTEVLDTTGAAVNGYRLVHRDGLEWDAAKLDAYSSQCSLIASTLDAIVELCGKLGYSVDTDSLRVLNGLDSLTTHRVLRSLPVLVMPFWDNSEFARYAMPSSDGSACMFRLAGKYENPAISGESIMTGVNKTVRQQKTAEWLKRPGGVWKNGWYEDQEGDKWYSDIISTDQRSRFGIAIRQFDTVARTERDCYHLGGCEFSTVVLKWGSKLSVSLQSPRVSSIAVSNGNRFGLFIFEFIDVRVVKNIYDWETLVSNISIASLLVRWLEAMCALQYGHARGESRWHNAGIGALANSKSFNLLPIVLLPRLKMTLAAFWTVGCDFEGDQKALSEAWFIIYPAIVELCLLYFSLMNVAAKVLRRRVSDAALGPTVLFFCVMHWCRLSIAQSGWFGVDGRVNAVVLSTEMDSLSLADFFLTDASFRMNGKISSLFAVKLAVLALNLLLLVFTRSTAKSAAKLLSVEPLKIERALAVRGSNLGGLGRSAVYEVDEISAGPRGGSGRALNSYELVRLGYVVYGDRFLVSIDDWEIIVSMGLLKGVYHLWNHRVAVFTLADEQDGGAGSSKTR